MMMSVIFELMTNWQDLKRWSHLCITLRDRLPTFLGNSRVVCVLGSEMYLLIVQISRKYVEMNVCCYVS